jgi:putative transposase
MHRTLKMEATSPAGSNFLPQQAKFDVFVQEFNNGELSYPFRARTALAPAAEESASTKKSISALLSQVRLWVSKKSTTVSRW